MLLPLKALGAAAMRADESVGIRFEGVQTGLGAEPQHCPFVGHLWEIGSVAVAEYPPAQGNKLHISAVLAVVIRLHLPILHRPPPLQIKMTVRRVRRHATSGSFGHAVVLTATREAAGWIARFIATHRWLVLAAGRANARPYAPRKSAFIMDLLPTATFIQEFPCPN